MRGDGFDAPRYVVRTRGPDGGWLDASPAASLSHAHEAYRGCIARRDGRDYDIFPVGDAGVRRLWPSDVPAMIRHLESLPPEDRRTRFHGMVSDDVIQDYCLRLDWRAAVVVGMASPDGELIGMAEAIMDDGEAPAGAEVGVSVAPQWRASGIGRRLARHAIGIAGAKGAARASLLYMSGTVAIPRLVRSLGGSVDPVAAEGVVAPRQTRWWQGLPPAA